MKKSSIAEYIFRVNTALSVYRENSSSTVAIDVLIKRFEVSKRQAYRYLQEAIKADREQKIPEAKKVLTVKLPESQIKELREHAKKSGIQLSTFVGSILGTFLQKKQKNGQNIFTEKS
jgi:putative heme degradation protein